MQGGGEMKLWPLPQRVKIGAHTYTVDYPHHFEKGPNGKYHGMACPNQQLIQVDNLDNHGDPIHPLCSIISLLHECVHEIDKLTGNHMFDDNTRPTEDKLDAFVEGLAAFLIDNGLLENTWDEALKGTHTHEDISQLYVVQNGRCAICQKQLESDYHVDHIMPITLGGSNEAGNLQLLCKHCKKSNGHPLEFLVSQGILTPCTPPSG